MRTPVRILVPVDFSPCSAAALEYAAALAAKLDASVDVLHVWQSPALAALDDAVHPLVVFTQTQAGQSMKAFLRALEQRALPATLVHGRLATGEPASTILHIAREGRFDLIVMGRHGRGVWSHLLVGSVAERVSRKSPIPVLTLHRGGSDAPWPLHDDVEARPWAR